MATGEPGPKASNSDLGAIPKPSTAAQVPAVSQPPVTPAPATDLTTTAETKVVDSSDSASRARSGGRHSGGNHKALSPFSRQGISPKMIRWRRYLNKINGFESTLQEEDDATLRKPVSYTHLTLPTILLV